MERLELPVADPDPIPLYTGNVEEDLKIVSRNRLAEKITGGLSWPSKMPCPSIGLSAFRCKMGTLLAEKPGSVCSSGTCYAKKGHFLFPTVQNKLEQRFQGLQNVLWTPSLIFLVRYYADGYFRLFESGDVQNDNHFRNLCTVARNVPDVAFWCPTKEIGVVKTWKNEIPSNLVVRVSAAMIDGNPPSWATTSTVFSDEPRAGSVRCPAPEQNNHCGGCRNCWDPAVKDVGYSLH